MSGQMHLNAFVSACPSPMFWGGWMHPGDKSAQGYSDVRFWIDLARTLERGCFDALFAPEWPGHEVIVPPPSGRFALPLEQLSAVLERWRREERTRA